MQKSNTEFFQVISCRFLGLQSYSLVIIYHNQPRVI